MQFSAKIPKWPKSPNLSDGQKKQMFVPVSNDKSSLDIARLYEGASASYLFTVILSTISLKVR